MLYLGLFTVGHAAYVQLNEGLLQQMCAAAAAAADVCCCSSSCSSCLNFE
jgi:hypothetical protein